MSARRAAWACVAALPAMSSAAQVEFLPQISVGGDSDTNRRLLRTPRASESGVLGATLTISRATEVDTLALVPRATISRFSGEDALDSDDRGVNGSWRHTGERFSADVQAGVADDSTLVTELGETGFVEGNTRRRSTTAAVLLTRYLATRHVVQFQFGGSDIDYQKTQGTGLVGYRYPYATAMYLYSLTPRLEGTLSLSAARLEVPEFDFTSDTRGAQVGLRYRMSERFDLEMRAGRSITSADERSDGKQSFHAGLSWHDERSKLSFEVSRDVEPSGRGVLVNADDLRFGYSRTLGERLSLDSALRVSRREDLVVSRGNTDYNFGTATFALSWKLDETWTMSLAGAYSRQEYESIYESAGRRLGLGVTWRPLRP